MPWLQVRLAISPEQAETYEDALLEVGAVSVTFMDAEDQPIFEPDLNTTPLWSHTHLLALFEADAEPEAVFAHLQLLTGAALPEHQAEVIEDQDWERSWMDNFQPMRFGQRLWIVPSWHAAPEPDAVNLLLDPGLAFGTGTHPTTALCLEWLDGQDLNGTEVLDFGCGSGILAIAALLLGARKAVGTDIDVQAIEASRDNAGRNGIADALFDLYLPQDMPAMQADVLVANILAGPLVSLAPQLSGLVRPGGLLALSGILAEQGDEVAAAYAKDFLFQEAQLKQPISTLSGGERNRLLLARALAQPANLLILDEPTNDLDMDTLEKLEELLESYDGTLILVSHDRDFVDRLATSTIALNGRGDVVETPGGWQGFLRQYPGFIAPPPTHAEAAPGARRV